MSDEELNEILEELRIKGGSNDLVKGNNKSAIIKARKR